MENGTIAAMKGLRRDGTSRSQETDSMTFHSRVLAGTALGLLMAASTAGAAGLPATGDGGSAAPVPLLMAQGDTDNTQRPLLEKKKEQAEKKVEKRVQQQEQPAAAPEKPRRGHQNGGEQPGENAGRAERNAQQPARTEAPAMKPERQKQRQPAEATGSGAAEGGAGNEQPVMRKHDKNRRQQTEGETPPVTQAPGNAQPANSQAPEMKRDKKHPRAEGKRNAPFGENQAEQPQTGKQPVEAAQPRPGTKPQPAAKSQTPAESTQPSDGGATNEAQSPEKKGEKNRHRPGQAESPDQNAGSGQSNGKEAGGQPAETAPTKAGQPELPGNAGTRQRGEKPAMEGQNGKGQNGKDRNGRPQVNEAANPLPENAAPVFDSDKRGNRRDNGQAGGNDRNNRHGGDRNGRNAQNGNQPPVNAGPPPRSDAAAQDFRRGGKFEIQSVDEAKGKRIEGDRRPRWQRRKDADVVKEIGSRVIINLGGQTIVQSTDNDRLGRHARDTYYEDLPHDRVRETIERPDGSRVVTIRNRYGDVIRRSRFTRDGREIVLVYVDDRDLERDRGADWRDPGDDLPPMRLTIPVSQYILDSDNVRDPDRYYEVLDQPPVERVERLYTLGDVRRSARVRDMMPRVDLDTINFDTGSAQISQDQVDDLQGVADAMKRIIDRNPGETFLIEGHTDAVGDPNSNLALSDQRAESVADVLTNDFEIPPENLVTQGYGEEYLKVDTDGPNRENRRVAIRRITPLVAPVAQQ
jgi:outer membrane protein OmpA-like peptidoglycan-associated protein